MFEPSHATCTPPANVKYAGFAAGSYSLDELCADGGRGAVVGQWRKNDSR